jgi:hypothetical protein
MPFKFNASRRHRIPRAHWPELTNGPFLYPEGPFVTSGLDEGKCIRLGYGAYGRAEISPITKQPMLAGDGFGAAQAPGHRAGPFDAERLGGARMLVADAAL